jgi:hypothetical protein
MLKWTTHYYIAFAWPFSPDIALCVSLTPERQRLARVQIRQSI